MCIRQYVAKAIYALLLKCRKNNLRTFGANVAKKFTHFVRKVFARKILPTGKLGLFRPLVQLGLVQMTPLSKSR